MIHALHINRRLFFIRITIIFREAFVRQGGALPHAPPKDLRPLESYFIRCPEDASPLVGYGAKPHLMFGSCWDCVEEADPGFEPEDGFFAHELDDEGPGGGEECEAYP